MLVLSIIQVGLFLTALDILVLSEDVFVYISLYHMSKGLIYISILLPRYQYFKLSEKEKYKNYCGGGGGGEGGGKDGMEWGGASCSSEPDEQPCPGATGHIQSVLYGEPAMVNPVKL